MHPVSLSIFLHKFLSDLIEKFTKSEFVCNDVIILLVGVLKLSAFSIQINWQLASIKEEQDSLALL